MWSATRRSTLSGVAVLFAGCMTGDDERDPSETSDTPPSTATQTTSPTPVPGQDVTLTYGESFVDADLTITVEMPTVETTFSYEGDLTPRPSPTDQPDSTEGSPQTTETDGDSDETDMEYEMPDGEALAFAPVTFENGHPEENRRMSSGTFVLVTKGTEFGETLDFDHPAFEAPVSRRDLGRIDTSFRWTMEGGVIRPGQATRTHALFVVPDDTDPAECDVVYDPTLGVEYDYYGNQIVTWTDDG